MSATNNFCTLFDSNYLPRALVMYQSLENTGDDFKLYVVCFDDLAYQILVKLKLPKVIPISLDAFESPQLLGIKGQRTAGEYCWTCTPHVIRYVLDIYKLPAVTYLDADLCFYSKPSLLLSEFESSGKSVLITEHRYTPRYAYLKKLGIYCVQFMTFKADDCGMRVLQWWQDRCLEWCHARYEDGKFGDQKYLDDWTQRFAGVHVLQHLGGGVAPWNVQQYKIRKNDHGDIEVNGWPLVFFHFHGYKHYIDGVHDLGNFRLDQSVVDLLYKPYIQNLAETCSKTASIYPGFGCGRAARPGSWKESMRKVRRYLRGEFNEYRPEDI